MDRLGEYSMIPTIFVMVLLLFPASLIVGQSEDIEKAINHRLDQLEECYLT